MAPTEASIWMSTERIGLRGVPHSSYAYNRLTASGLRCICQLDWFRRSSARGRSDDGPIPISGDINPASITEAHSRYAVIGICIARLGPRSRCRGSGWKMIGVRSMYWSRSLFSGQCNDREIYAQGLTQSTLPKLPLIVELGCLHLD